MTETGLGRWSRDDFYRAMNEGIAADGEHLYPAFPYPYFTLMPREDVDAIYDYLRTLEPVRAEKPENELPFPFNIRQAVAGLERCCYFEEAEFVPDPDAVGRMEPRPLSCGRAGPLRRLPYRQELARRRCRGRISARRPA